VVRRLTGPVENGFHRLSWDLRYPAEVPARLPSEHHEENPFESRPRGPMVVPGAYTVSLAKRVAGTVTELAGPQPFKVTPLGLATLKAEDQAAVFAFEEKTGRLQRAVLGAVEATKDARARIAKIKVALADTPADTAALAEQARSIDAQLADLEVALSGDHVLERHNEPTLPSIVDRVQGIVSSEWATTQAPTQTMRDAYTVAGEEFVGVLAKLHTLVEIDLKHLDETMEKIGAPWTPGRVPDWTPE
jgi:hypothetical protein